MKLTEIRLRQFRVFRKGLDVTDLDPGLTIFHGPNESGKSTLAYAVKTAFLERHNTGTLSDLQPWGDSAATPEVSLKFDYDGQAHHLTKRFVKQRRCDLAIDGKRLSGDDAEQYLAGLMGFTVPARGASKPEHWGVPGLLWIEQGSGHQLQASVQHAHDHLQGVLSDAMGHVASSDGDRILQRVTDRLEQLVTRNGAPRNDYRRATEEKQRISDELESLRTRIRTYQQDVDELAVLQTEHDRDAQEQPWRELRQREQDARRQLDDANAMRAAQKRESDVLQVCQQTQALLHQQLQTFRQQELGLRTREQEFADERERYQSLSSQTVVLQQAREKALVSHRQARETLALCRQEQQRQEKKRQLLQGQNTLQQLSGKLEQAAEIQTCLDADRKQARALRIDADALKQLRALDDQLQSLEIRQQAMATRLRFDLDDGQSMVLDGVRVSGQVEHLLLDTTLLEISGVGKVSITPGGDEVAGLAREHARLSEDRAVRLRMLNVESTGQAQQRATDYADVAARIRHNEAVLAVHAPAGIDMLKRQRDDQLAQLDVLQRDYDALPPVSESRAGDVAEVQAAEQRAEHELQSCESRLQTHLLAIATAKAALDAAQREYQLAKNTVDNADRASNEQQTLRRLNEERAKQAALNDRIADLEQRINAVRPDILEQDIARYRQSATRMQEIHAERERKIRELKGALQAVGAQGLEEQHNALSVQYAVVARRVDEFSRNVAALSLLHDLLREKRQTLTRQLHEPLKRRLMHYLEVLFNTSSVGDFGITLGDDLMPASLIRHNDHADLEALSFGAREQMGLISRLAYADLLKEAGQPTLLMLDDALVHSDDTRLVHMKRILFDAAERHQILLFTCHPEKWRDMGVRPRAIRDMVL